MSMDIHVYTNLDSGLNTTALVKIRCLLAISSLGVGMTSGWIDKAQLYSDDQPPGSRSHLTEWKALSKNTHNKSTSRIFICLSSSQGAQGVMRRMSLTWFRRSMVSPQEICQGRWAAHSTSPTQNLRITSPKHAFRQSVILRRT